MRIKCYRIPLSEDKYEKLCEIFDDIDEFRAADWLEGIARFKFEPTFNSPILEQYLLKDTELETQIKQVLDTPDSLEKLPGEGMRSLTVLRSGPYDVEY
jgi:hypothetical protein